nr:RNA-directed DNA polymerase, eukaryota [Tanacetum cinerariifolium]
MHFMGFSEKWIKWIKGCLYSATSSILINGSPTRVFNINRGLRQRDPLSPFLFIIAMEGLHVAVEDALSAGLYRGLKVNTLTLSHFFYTDDALFIGEWSRANIKSMVSILECFYQVSGLKINFHKSNLVGVGVPFEDVNHFALNIGCNAMQFPFVYLGLPVDCNMANTKSWGPIFDKFSKRLSKWKSYLLSIGGRSTLISSVLEPLEFGVVRSINSMHKKGLVLHSFLQRHVNNGTSTKFWSETWMGDSLKNQFPGLFRLTLNKDCTIRDRWNNGWALDWSRPITGGTNTNHLSTLFNMLATCSLTDSDDTWTWSLGSSTFAVKSIRDHINQCTLPNGGFETRWNRYLSKKINIFIWRALRDRLPTRWNLSRKGIDMDSLTCPICDSSIETTNHTLWFCSFATTLWQKIFWAGFSFP